MHWIKTLDSEQQKMMQDYLKIGSSKQLPAAEIAEFVLGEPLTEANWKSGSNKAHQIIGEDDHQTNLYSLF